MGPVRLVSVGHQVEVLQVLLPNLGLEILASLVSEPALRSSCKFIVGLSDSLLPRCRLAVGARTSLHILDCQSSMGVTPPRPELVHSRIDTLGRLETELPSALEANDVEDWDVYGGPSFTPHARPELATTCSVGQKVTTTAGLRHAEVYRLLGTSFFKGFSRRTHRLGHDIAHQLSWLRRRAARFRCGRNMYKACLRGVVLPVGACLCQARGLFEIGRVPP